MDIQPVGLNPRLTVQGRALEVAWWGPHEPAGPAIVLLHEGLGSVSLWRDVPAAIAGRTSHRVMAYSRFGHGTSDLPAAEHTTAFMHDEARLLPEILDRSGIDRAILFGHSTGGSIALIAAAEFPSRVHAMILEAPHVFVEDVAIASIERMRTLYTDTDLRQRLSRHHVNPDAAFRGWNDVWLAPEFRSWNLDSSLPAVTCPTLLIQGELDRYGTLAQIDAIERQVAGPVERLILADCGHQPHRDQRAAVLDAVESFVKRVS